MKNSIAVAFSLIALGFMVLSFLSDWLFIAPAALFSWLGWRELIKKK